MGHLPNLPTGVGKFDVLEFIEFFNLPAQKPQNRVASWEVPEFIEKLNLPTGKKLKGSPPPKYIPL